MKIPVVIIIFATITATMPGCTTFHPKPISPSLTASAFESRTLDNQGLKGFMGNNLHREIAPWPPRSWDIEMLTLAAFYYHPDMDVARAGWEVARAGVITAGGRPNPGIGFTPQYNADTAGWLSPWTLGFNLDIPMETAGKRGYRIARAEHISEAARLNIAGVAWQVRSRLRRNLLSLYRAEQTETLVQKQQKVQEEIVRLLEQRLSFGEASQPDVTQVSISLAKTLLSLGEAQKQRSEARVQVAEALGLPVDALNNIHISFDFIEQIPLTKDIPLKDVRHQALLSRSDILGALSEYAASESALQLEIAKQYPDIHIGPGYEYDQGDNKWSLGFSISLPILNRNQGPIAEAEARRKEAETRFIALQSRIIAEIDRESAGFNEALKKLQVADSLLSTQRKQMQAMLKMFNYGEADCLAFKEAQMKLSAAEFSRLEAFILSQQSLGQLEDAVQHPLNSLEPFPTSLETSPRGKKEISK